MTPMMDAEMSADDRVRELEQEVAALKKQWNDLDTRTEKHHLEWTVKWLNIQSKIRFWSYCTWRGMKAECPEKHDELREWFRELNIDPYASETAK